MRERCYKQAQANDEGDLPERRRACSHRGSASDASEQEEK
jgi:hypothetical protein